MTLRELKTIFEQEGLPLNEAELCVCDCVGATRAELYGLKNFEKKQWKKMLRVVSLRKKGVPYNLIFKKQNFFGRDFTTSRHVLKPRQETELLAREALLEAKNGMRVLDLCTGSGIVGLTMLLEGQNQNKEFIVTLADISTSALRLARKNAKKFNAKVGIIKSNMFKNIARQFDIITINPPYIKSGDITSLQTEVKKFDPHLALDGGSDGLQFYRNIEKNAPANLAKNGTLLMEIGFDQAQAVTKIFENWNSKVVKDFDGNDRVIICKKN